jgi:glycosyltransferase involved in cell wall biosynthesis
MSSTTAATTSEPAAARGIARALVTLPVPLGAGGLGTAAAEFLAGLGALGVDARWVGPQPLGAATRVVVSRPYKRCFGAAGARRLGSRAVRRAVPREGWDLVYGVPGSVPVEIGRGIRVVHQANRHPAVEWAALRRGERETGGRGDMSRLERRRFERELGEVDLVHVSTAAVRDELLAAGIPPERLVLAPLGVDLDRFRPAAKADRLTVAFVGPLSLRKGVEVVAELADRLGDDAELEVVGGPTCPWSRRIAARMRFATMTSVPEMLAAAHCMVLPSRSDGFSYAVLEALASGTVPIVTPEVGAAEIVRRLDERLVVEREGFAETTLALLPRLDFESLGPRARALAEEYDRRRTGPAAAAAVLERALANRGSR